MEKEWGGRRGRRRAGRIWKEIPRTPPARWGSPPIRFCRNLGLFLSKPICVFFSRMWSFLIKILNFPYKLYEVVLYYIVVFLRFSLVVPFTGKGDSNLAAKPLTLNPCLGIPKIYRASLSEYKFPGFNISCVLHFLK